MGRDGRRRVTAHTIRIDQYRQYRETSFLDDLDDEYDHSKPIPKREREFVNLSPDVTIPGRVAMVPASRTESGVCPVCRMSFHGGDTIAIPDDHHYRRTYPKFHAYCWKRAADERQRALNTARPAELVFGGGLS